MSDKKLKDSPELETEMTPEVDANGYETVSEAEVNEVMKKYDRESNTRIWTGIPQRVVQGIMALFSLYCIYSTLFSTASLEKRLTAFLGCVIVMGFLYYPASKHHAKPNYIPWYDVLIMLVGAGCFFYYCAVADDLIKVLSSASKMTPMYCAIGAVGILVLAELCRRCVGVPILIVVGALLLYTFGIANLSLERALYTLFYRTGGVIGTPIQVCAKFIVVFIVFGAFLERTGISKFFIDLANKVAGAVEAAASTGGQIMPPIMGAAAFLMAEYIGIPYGQVALKAILPAFLYFAGIFIAVHLEAKKLGLKGISRTEMVPGKELFKKSYLLFPIVLLVYLVSTNACTMQYAAALSIIASVVVGLINREAKLTPMKIVEALEAGGKGTITVAVACAMAGVIAGCITATGLASKLISSIVALSGNTLIIGLFLTMLCCIILGMGVPTTANYCIMAATCAPILIKLGVPQVAAHFFVFYFGIVADITPPVALAAYAGSAIAKSNPMRTGVNATKLAIAAFIVPYIFAYSPVLLFENVSGFFEVVQICVSAFIGIFGVAACLNGYMFKEINVVLRIALLAGGLTLIIPGLVTDIIGLVLVLGVVAYQYISAKRDKHAMA